MRLINTTTLQLEEYFDRKIPPYAILSHRWEEEEVTFQDMIAEGAANSFKITGCCQRAREDGLKYAWIDTCCIDKSSSAELSEAINSMFKWYKNAEVCYAYLSDVLINGFDSTSLSSMFRRSRWFTRGWTLQELLAPHTIIFFDITWTEIGTKLQLRPLIEQITGITHLLNFNRASIAQKMSWAAERVTTRVEDQAYCLMGLFGVNMPPLYGEGDNAFRRLQLEILEVSDDESIFAWKEDLLWDTAGRMQSNLTLLQR
ncbi:HET-domain-containing protein [Mollisia scopiformis]|uniref:HET-domain-containing protein n=1 Tax=Mollisia scopiformis TaxID=149040 RepID=A0A194WUR6_MOLSC|nr:HET-domain-containing protein [Mollisia scopiformis]KUJ11357.1 HET-domain-containing protein [Mollisia scopiformis]